MKKITSVPEVISTLVNPFKRVSYHISSYTIELVDPLETSPLVARNLRKITRFLFTISLYGAILSVLLAFYDLYSGLWILLATVFVYLVAEGTPYIWRSLLASGIDNELPALLLYLVPYVGSPKYLADVLSSVPSYIFKWIKHESAKIKLLYSMGYDPLGVLKKLQESTPSKKLQLIITEYLNMQAIGATNTAIALRITNRTLENIKEKWSTYSKIGRIGVEAAVTSLIALGVMLPISSGSSIALILSLPFIAILLSSLILLMTRPKVGDMPRDRKITGVTIAGLSISIFGIIIGEYVFAVLALLVSSIVGEFFYYKLKKKEQEALINLRVAVEKAKYGQDYEEYLRKASTIDEGILNAVIQASRIAGTIGLGEALSQLIRILDEAFIVRRNIWFEAIILEAISILAPVISIITLEKTIAFMQSTSGLLGISLMSVDMSNIIVLAPLAPIIASILRRGCNYTTTSSLISLVTLFLVIML